MRRTSDVRAGVKLKDSFRIEVSLAPSHVKGSDVFLKRTTHKVSSKIKETMPLTLFALCCGSYIYNHQFSWQGLTLSKNYIISIRLKDKSDNVIAANLCRATR